MSNFSQIPQGRFFKTKDGSTYKKIDQQVYVDVGTGIETYWEPLFDSRIVSPFATPDAPTDPDLKFQVDPQTRASIMKVYAPKYGEAAVDGVIKRYFYGS